MLDVIAILLSGVAAFLILAPLVKKYCEWKEEMQADEEGGEDDVHDN